MSGQRAEVVVVGGGAIGVATAYHLARAGADVVLLERNAGVGAEASYGNAGFVSPSHCIPLAGPGVLRRVPGWLRDRGGGVFIKPRISPELARFGFELVRASGEERMLRGLRALRDASRDSRDRIAAIVADESLEVGYRHHGLANVCVTEQALAALVEDAELLRREGFDPVVLDARAARERVPALSGHVLGGVFWGEDAHVTPHVLVPSLAAAAERHGARIVHRAVVTGFGRDAAGRVVSVETDGGAIACERVVLAAGWESVALARRLGVRLPVEPGKGYHVHLEGNPPGLTIPLILQESVVGATPMGSELRFAGTMEFVGADRTLAPDRARRLIRGAARYLQGLDPEQPARLWTGFRPCTPDSLPLLGPLRASPNVVVATGHGMLGITLAGSTGADAAALATDRPASAAAQAFSPARFGL